MNDKLHEQLSALVDDELTESERTLLVKRIAVDDDLHQRLSRYQLISDALQNHLPDRVDPGFSARVRTVLRTEPAATSVTPGRRLAALVRPAAGLALAASVAVVAVLSLQSVRQQSPATPVVAKAPDAADYIRAGEAGHPADRSRVEKKLDIYLVNHNEYAVNRGMRGMLPYVRLVGHEMASDNRE
jgi:sigma-E factor negative regulatory protein RseA